MIPTKWRRLTARKRLNLRVFIFLLRLCLLFSNDLRQNWLKLSPWLLHESLSILCAQCLLLPECSYCGDSTQWKLEFPTLYKHWTGCRDLTTKEQRNIVESCGSIQAKHAEIATCSKPLDAATCMSQVLMYMQ